MSTAPQKIELRLFDPQDELGVVERRLPHWTQPGVIAFITWRTNDSIPAEVLRQWREDRRTWLIRHGITEMESTWGVELHKLPPEFQEEYHRTFSDRWHETLDDCHGDCALRRSEVGQIVAESLRFFDGTRYELTDYVVMPNHVHLLAAFPDHDGMLNQCESWKHFQAVSINRMLGRKGRFWQPDSFDHLVRSEKQFEHLRRYIASNGPRAALTPNEYIHFSKKLM